MFSLCSILRKCVLSSGQTIHVSCYVYIYDINTHVAHSIHVCNVCVYGPFCHTRGLAAVFTLNVVNGVLS